ncbi:hypothetical protein ACFX13_022894 [Malus domestica]
MQGRCPNLPIISSPAEILANNENLLTPILLCIPTRALLRLKCVCKRWLSLISDPKFCDNHTFKNPYPNFSAFFNTTMQQFYRISIQNNENTFKSPSKHPEFIRGLPRSLKILQSCNGLLLCCTSHEITNLRSTPTYYVLNPTTNHFVALANSPYATNSTSLLGVALAFDPSKSIHYKVICVQCIAGSVVSFQIEIYSSETRNWTLRKSTFDRPFHIDFSHGVYFNGAINWISRTSRLLHYHLDHEEGHGLVSRPPDYNVFRKREYIYFGESRGHLHLIEIYRPCFTQFDVMEMGRDYSGWFVKYHVDLDTITAKFPEMVPQHNLDDPSEENWYYEFVVLFLVREENEEETAMFLYIPCKVISYNLLDRTCKTACELTLKGKRSLQIGWRDTYHCMETLACV